METKTTFTGYTKTSHEANIVALFDEEGQSVETLVTAGSVILDRTPFYGESGGQAGDTGSLWVGETEIVVRDTQKPTQDLVEHQRNTCCRTGCSRQHCRQSTTSI